MPLLFAPLKVLGLASLSLVAACASAPFSYSDDRCRGAYNQCRNSCKDMPSGGASAACYDRCLASEQRCYAVGDDGVGSSLAQESLIQKSRSEAEKEADYRRWKAKRQAADREAEMSEPDADD